MKPKLQERGQALILIVFAAVGLFGFAALAIDGSRVFSDRRHGQNAADTSVLAAALAKIRNPTDPTAAETAARARADSNGFNNTNSTITVYTCDQVAALSLQPPCEGLPALAVPAEYIQVVIRLTTKTTFARIIGRPEVPSVVSAIARVQGSSSTGSSSNDAAMFATQSGDVARCFDMQGGPGAVLHTHGSNISVNCTNDASVFLSGNAQLQMDTPGDVAGCSGVNGGFQLLTPFTCYVNGTPPQSTLINASTYASVPTMPAPPPCSSYSSMTLTNGNNQILAPGVYCLDSLTMLNGATLSGPSGTVQIVLGNGGMNITGGIANFADLEIYSDNGSVLIGAQAVFTANRLRFYSSGAGSFNVQAGGQLTSPDAYFYFHSGNIDWNGQAHINLHGPAQGDTYGGLLIYKPWDNTSPITLNGGTDIHLTGTFLVPNSPLTLNGGTGLELHSQLIASTFKINGSANVDIYYLPSENYSPPNSPTIQLTK